MTNPDFDYIRQVTMEYTKTLAQSNPKLATLHSPTDNPFWEKVKTLPGENDPFSGKWHPKFYEIGRDGQMERFRDKLVQVYSWAIPDPLSLSFVVEHSQGRIVEMACGTGYWLWQLSQLAIDVIGYDEYPPHLAASNHWHCPRDKDNCLTGETGKNYINVQSGTPEMLEQHADRTLFLCWPPYDTGMATECLKHYRGKRLIYIGEGDGGCTADDAFHETLVQEWEEVDSHVPIQWEGIHDYITVYDRLV